MAETTLTTDILDARLTRCKTPKAVIESGALLDLIDSHSKELFSVFAEHDGFEMLWAYEDKEATLDFLIDMALVLVNSFDERLGVMSALVYYLCDRDSYSIDIQWAWKDAKRMSQFLLWVEDVLQVSLAQQTSGERGETSRSDVCWLVKCLSLLDVVLSDYPPARVTPLMWESMFRLIPTLLRASEALTAGGCHTGVRQQTTGRGSGTTISNVLNSICYFGLGLTFREYVRDYITISDRYLTLPKDTRCSCKSCDLIRVGRKAIKQRDEFPIPQNAGTYLSHPT
ncbi:hypothetical protein GNI_078980 [Gregarina niphandrodes]|uniref:Uncharacterized protein n=1 Tax=Gregarina niphandrodes TaxID=110365 RepID=A0A023B6J9_GRENI|nr:hypothetical protein GNI_078980 [Gregarina niphandrodes]EZG66579.1 hypothetical protein GNI_078980 [Gregarina niphandrodes]|eukprot:XP_011130588.1 hypothetical protein GNI_078980 [Gregarina niphandrodes]